MPIEISITDGTNTETKTLTNIEQKALKLVARRTDNPVIFLLGKVQRQIDFFVDKAKQEYSARRLKTMTESAFSNFVDGIVEKEKPEEESKEKEM